MVNKAEPLFDRFIVIPFICLTLISLVFIFSSSSVISYEKFSNPFFYLNRQLIAISISIVAASVFLFVPMSFHKENGALLIFSSLFLLILVAIPMFGTEVNGSRRWINLFGLFNIQPSEIAKIFIPIYLCGYCLRRKEQLESSWYGFLKPLLLISLCCILLLLEPDVGATVVLFGIGIVILFAGGAKFSQLASLALIFVLLISIFVYFDETRLTRVLSFSDPFDDPTKTDYQLLNALIASVQGGLFGLGIGESTQKYFFLPEAHTDFIFSIYMEETGLFGLIVLIGIYLIILSRLFNLSNLAMKKNFYFNGLIIIAFALIFFIQTILNIFVNIGIVPTKGLALPFISYGRSSVIMNFIALAIMLRASWEFRNNIR
ncbi:MAG: putative lipid II flippase FtsW [SAR86 cluster bacterium]|uniref:Probable peptidoglycan glycosyltransferase FtsW n=1 Tax=SAR86 cluster bacterium TaxID=2030880 RepID=A0A520N1G8_9GAMM|nr:MAG: putative lipid II flippase FtsW [SAR86 cluster bacterium]